MQCEKATRENAASAGIKYSQLFMKSEIVAVACLIAGSLGVLTRINVSG